MAGYIEFQSAEGSVLVEVDEEETSQKGGIQKAGLREMASKSVAIAQTSFENAIHAAICCNAQVFLNSVLALSPLPSEAEISFGLKMTGEAGNVAVGKVGGETNYAIRLTWKREAKAAQ
jgi:hypothetical protein